MDIYIWIQLIYIYIYINVYINDINWILIDMSKIDIDMYIYIFRNGILWHLDHSTMDKWIFHNPIMGYKWI